MSGELKGIWEALGVDPGGVAQIDQIMAGYNDKANEMVKAIRSDYENNQLIPPAALFFFLMSAILVPGTDELDPATVMEFMLIFAVFLYREAIREG